MSHPLVKIPLIAKAWDCLGVKAGVKADLPQDLLDNPEFQADDKLIHDPTIRGKLLAAYVGLADMILLEPHEYVNSNVEDIAPLIHETIHWTGHPSRLNRMGVGMGVPRPRYLMMVEEFVADSAGALVAAAVGRPDASNWLRENGRGYRMDISFLAMISGGHEVRDVRIFTIAELQRMIQEAFEFIESKGCFLP